MIRSIVLCLLAASTALAFPADTPAAGGCPGGYAEGAEIERGRLVYICQGGQVVPKGCIAEDLSRIAVGASYDKKVYRVKCQLSGSELTFEKSGCLQNGAEHKVDETWDDASNFYTCKADGDALKIVNLGCVDGGKRVNIKDSITKEDASYTCEEQVNGGSKLIPSGCVKDGKTYKAGDAFEAGKYWFNCTRIGREKVQARAAGCVNGGKRLNDGDRYQENEVSFECRVDANKQEVLATGCVQSDGGTTVDRRLGCTWVEGQAPFQYEWTCRHDAAANTAVKEQIRCNYNVGGGVYNIEPGCFRVVEKSAVGCLKDGKMLKIQAFQGDNAESSAQGAGLHAC